MCTFITATIDDCGLTEGQKVRIGPAQFKVIDNPYVQGQLPTGRTYLVHLSGHCDCDTIFGRGLVEHQPTFSDAEVAKLVKEGWSEAKIERWKAQRTDADLKRQERKRGAIEKQVARWREVVAAALEWPTVTAFGLMHHFYRADADSERFPVSVCEPMPQAALTEEFMFGFPEDTLQEFTAR